MAGRVHVVFAFARLQEARYAAELAQSVELAQAARNELVGIRLVAHIEKQLVMGQSEHAVACQNKFDYAKARRHMAARFRRGRNNLLTISDASMESSSLVRSFKSAGDNHIEMRWLSIKGTPNLRIQIRHLADALRALALHRAFRKGASLSEASSVSEQFGRLHAQLHGLIIKSSAASSGISSPRTCVAISSETIANLRERLAIERFQAHSEPYSTFFGRIGFGGAKSGKRMPIVGISAGAALGNAFRGLLGRSLRGNTLLAFRQTSQATQNAVHESDGNRLRRRIALAAQRPR